MPPAVSDKIATTFTVTATAAADQNLYVVGDIPALGSWAPADAIKLTAQGDNLYSGVIELPKSTAVEYKFIKKTTAGAVIWESGSNRAFTTPARLQPELHHPGHRNPHQQRHLEVAPSQTGGGRTFTDRPPSVSARDGRAPGLRRAGPVLSRAPPVPRGRYAVRRPSPG